MVLPGSAAATGRPSWRMVTETLRDVAFMAFLLWRGSETAVVIENAEHQNLLVRRRGGQRYGDRAVQQAALAIGDFDIDDGLPGIFWQRRHNDSAIWGGKIYRLRSPTVMQRIRTRI